MKRIFLVSLTFCTFLVPILSNATLCDAQPVTGPQNLLTQSSPENKIEMDIRVWIHDVNLTNLGAEVTIFLKVQFPYKRVSDNLDVWLFGDGEASISCTLSERDNTRTSYIGWHDQTRWLIQGNQEFYPFENYYTRFKIFPYLEPWEENYGFIFSENSGACFSGDKGAALKKTFKTTENGRIPISPENYSELVFGKKNYPMLRVHIEKEERFGILILAPVFLAYALLASSFMIKVPGAPKRKRDLGVNLRNRLTIYLALFAFSIGFFFSIGSISPSELSLAAVLGLNLSICVSLSGIFSIASNTISKNLNLVALISCAVSTYLVLWSQFLGGTTIVSITLGVPMLIFLVPVLLSVLFMVYRTLV